MKTIVLRIWNFVNTGPSVGPPSTAADLL